MLGDQDRYNILLICGLADRVFADAFLELADRGIGISEPDVEIAHQLIGAGEIPWSAI